MTTRLMRWLLGSLRRQLTIGISVMMSLLMAVFVSYIYISQASLSTENHRQQVVALAQNAAIASATWLSTRDYAALQEVMMGYNTYPDLMHAMVLDQRGQVLAHNQAHYIGRYVSDMPAGKAFSLTQTAEGVDVFYPVLLSGHAIGWIKIGVSQAALVAELDQIQRAGLVFIVLGVLGSVFFATFISYFFVSRLKHIEVVADAVEAGNAHARALLSGNDEAAILANQFNRMLSSLAEREKAILKSETRFRSIMSNLPLPIAYLSWNGDVLMLNQRFLKVIGYDLSDLTNIDQWWALAYPDAAARKRYQRIWEAQLNDAIAEGREIKALEYKIRCKDGEDRIFEVSGAILDHELLLAFVDVTSRVAFEREIHTLAYFDSLTGLPNRAQLIEALAMINRDEHEQTCALLFLDLDFFKTLNDTLGHAMGDLLLKQVAQRLQHIIAEKGTVFRLGGDEFVILLENLREQFDPIEHQLQHTVLRILTEINHPFALETHTYKTSTSIGLVVFETGRVTSSDLLKQADIAMYQAKKAGRNQVSEFDESMQRSIDIRVALEVDLAGAIVAGQLQLAYQLQVDHDGKPIGAEVLLRWLHPKRGFVSPAEFIPLAEETGTIVDIGIWVLTAACAQLQQWQQSPLTQSLTLSVNVSAKQFFQSNFVEQVTDLVAHYGINPQRLKLELTESILLDHIDEIVEIMHSLKKLGIVFSLDDFGTGYSSLQYLKQLPLYQLKIDQSFVRDLTVDSSDSAIVRTIIAMAQSLNLHVIAEGVETPEQRQMLLNDGCQAFQGYLFAKPMPITDFDLLLTQLG